MIQNTVRVVQRTTFYVSIVGTLAVLIMMLLTVADVMGRSFFIRPITGTYELSRYLLVVIVLLGIGYAQQTGRHVAVNYFVSKLPPRGRFVFEAMGTVLGLVFFSLVAWRGWEGGWDAVHAKTVSDTLRISTFPFEFLVAVGAFFLCIELLLKLLSLISLKKT